MPIKTDKFTEHSRLWSLYVNELEKAKFLKSLAEQGKQRQGSAAIRAMMYLYVNDNDFQKKVNTKINDFLVFNKDGSTSQM